MSFAIDAQKGIPKIKGVSAGISDIDGTTGTAILQHTVYTSDDRDRDRANQGMFTKSWQEFKDVKFFKNHNKETGPGKVIKLWDDSKAAYAQVQFGRDSEGTDMRLKM